jgi:two-component system LytT family sensor kinase
LIIGVSLLLLILWAQSGFRADAVNILFLITNYGVWTALLPWINGWVESYTFKSNQWVLSGSLLLLIITTHWIASNVVLYVVKYLFLGHDLFPTWLEVKGFLVPSIVSRMIDLTVFIGILVWLHQNRQLQQQRLAILEKEANGQRNKLQALKNQLNPHFLFNTMHTISSLIGHEDEKAQNLTIKMSHLLRKMLVINEKEMHAFSEEIAFVEDYLAIESERFHDRLTIDFEVAPTIGKLLVPTMIIQPLVENAFKHGVSQMTKDCSMNIRISMEDNRVKIKVVNDIPTVSNTAISNGVGLRNLGDRLATHYGDNAMLTLKRLEKQFEVTIDLPT